MDHFCKVTELTFANTNQPKFEKTKDTSNLSPFVAQYISNHNWLAVVDEHFINDNFNLYGIPESVSNFSTALKILKGEINIKINDNSNEYSNKAVKINNTNNEQKNNSLNQNPNLNNLNNMTNIDITSTGENENRNKLIDELPDDIEKSCIDAYNLIHARFIQTPKGLQIMRRKYEAGIFGVCPRFLCNGQNLLPFGSSMMTHKALARGYCPLCHDVYESDVLIEEQLEIQRKKNNTLKIGKNSTDNSDNQINESDNNEKTQNKNTNNSLNSNEVNRSSENSESDNENKNTNDNSKKSDQPNDNNNNNDDENANLSECAEVINNSSQKKESQDIEKDNLDILDGSSFGPYFPHFFLQMNRDLIPTTFNPTSEKSEKLNSSVFSTVSSKKSLDWKQDPAPAPFAKTEQMKYTIFGIPIDPDSDFNPHRVIRDRSAFENS